MSAYVIVEVTVTDPEAYREYAVLAQRTVEEAGGRYIVRGGATETFEGEWNPKRVVVLAFDDMEVARTWYRGPGYEAARVVRQGAALMNMVLVEGFEGS